LKVSVTTADLHAWPKLQPRSGERGCLEPIQQFARSATGFTALRPDFAAVRAHFAGPLDQFRRKLDVDGVVSQICHTFAPREGLY
jgi:hypothetical protein